MPAIACIACGSPTSKQLLREQRCPDCQRQHKLGWSWSKVRAGWLAEHPACAVCGRPATDVDHRVPRAHGGGTTGNLQSLCADCHKAKTQAQRRARILSR